MTQPFRVLWLSLSGMLLLQPAVLANELDHSEFHSKEQDAEKPLLADSTLPESIEPALESRMSDALAFEGHLSETDSASTTDSASANVASYLMHSAVDDGQPETAIAVQNAAQSVADPQSTLPHSEVLVAQAEEEPADAGIPGTFSGSVALTTNYVFRGITQTDNNPAIQGTLDYGLELSDQVGVYAGIFGSNVDFNDGDQASIEIDLYTGVAYQPTDKLSTSFTAFYYLYPGADSSLNYDYFEFVADAVYDLETVALGATASYAPDNFASSGDAFYLEGRADVPLPRDLTLSGAIGYQAIDDNTAFGAPDYLNWSVGLGYSVAGFDLSLKYTDTDLSSAECFGGTDFCDARAVFTVSRSL